MVVRVKPEGDTRAGIGMGIYARETPGGTPNEVARALAEFPAGQSDDYRTVELGVFDLKPGSTIWVRPNSEGSFGQVEATYIDRVFLITAE